MPGSDGVRLVPDAPPVPPSDSGWLRAQLAVRDARIEALAAQVEELRRKPGGDSSTSSKPSSSDSPYKKKPEDRSLRGRSGREPGRQPGAQSSALSQSGNPGKTVECGPAACGCCGHGLADVPVAGMQKRQVFEAAPPPPPEVTECQVQAKVCPQCGETSAGLAPAGVTGGIRGKAAARLGPFPDRVRDLLRDAGVLYADETPARTAGKLRYVHVACTEFLTAMHTGDRTKAAIDAGGVLPGYTGTIVRDGYAGYDHLTDALHAWCGARALAAPLTDANAAASAARAAGRARLDDTQLAGFRARYRGAVAKGLADNQGKRTQIGKDGRRLARRFRACQDMIPRFATDLTVGLTSNQAERDIRPVKVQMRTSGGCWRTLAGLAGFAVVQSAG